MAEVITMLALSPTMEEGTIAEWLKPEGSTVEEGELIAEIETDKATMEMESFFEGTVLKVLVKAGDAVKVGDPMAVIGEPGEDADAALADYGQAPASEDKPAPSADAQPEPKREDAPEAQPEQDQGSDADRIFVSPVAKNMAQEANLDLSKIKGSGPNGRIVKADVEQAISAGKASAKAAPPAQPAQPTSQPKAPAGDSLVIGQMPDAGGHGEPMSQMRKTIAKRLTQVWQNTPHFYLTMNIDMAEAMAFRKQINAQLERAGFDAKVSVNDLIIKACAIALKRFPRMNVAFNGDELQHFDQVHIGVAVAIEDGLITPTVRDADQKSLAQISEQVRELATKARDKKLKPNEYGGSTFTISNLGMYGIDDFCAVINPPEAGILACGAVQQVPVVVNGELAVGTRMRVTLSCDHRAVDGAVGAQFLQHVKSLLENPVLISVA